MNKMRKNPPLFKRLASLLRDPLSIDPKPPKRSVGLLKGGVVLTHKVKVPGKSFFSLNKGSKKPLKDPLRGKKGGLKIPLKEENFLRGSSF